MEVQHAQVAKNTSKPRLLSLDALRGFDMFWILGGEALFIGLFAWTGWQGWKLADAQMHHSVWHGFTFYDLIFPLFIFLSGVALGLSPKRLDKLPFKSRLPIYQHAVKRLVLLVFLGILYNHGWGAGVPFALDEIRYASVLGRIAFAWFFAAILVWHTCLRTQIIVAIAILVIYSFIQLFIPVPNGVAGDLSFHSAGAGSINAYIDGLLLPGITYQGRALDPEGILSTIPAVVNALLGVFTGHFIAKSYSKGEWAKVGILLLAGLVSLGLGWLSNGVIPVNKELWTSSFVLVTTGWSLILLSLFYGLIDVLKWQRLAFVFSVIGCNAIIIYLSTSLVKWDYISQSLFGGLIRALPEPMQLLAGTVGLLAVQWLFLLWMYKRGIFVKV